MKIGEKRKKTWIMVRKMSLHWQELGKSKTGIAFGIGLVF